VNPREPPQPSAQLKAKSPPLHINCGKTTAVPLVRIKKIGSGQKRCSKTDSSRSEKICSDAHRSLRGETHTESEMLAGFHCEGHWVVWKSEWGGAHWAWDIGHSSGEVSNRAA
jgi:hypothetical protein